MRSATQSLDRLRGGWLAGVVTLVGAGVPLAYFEARVHRWAPWIWPLPAGAIPRVEIALYEALPIFVIAGGIAWWLEESERTRKLFRVTVAPLLVAALTWLAYRFRNHYGPVGDGFGTWGKIADDPFLVGSEPLGHYILYWFNHHFGDAGIQPGGPDPVRRNALELAAISAGALCLAGSQFLVGKALPDRSRWVITLALFGVPTWLLFAGFVETTPFAYAFTTLYLVAVLRYLEVAPARAPLSESLLLAMALVTHGVACSITGAHAVLVGYWLFKKGPLQFRRLLISLATAAAPFVPLAVTLWYAYRHPGPTPLGIHWYGNALGGQTRHRMFVPLAEIWTARFWLERLNLILSACPIFPLVIPAFVGLVRARRSIVAAILGAGLIGTMGIEFLWNSELGAYQDFDLMSLFAVPANLLVLKWLSLRLTPSQLRVSTAAIVAANVSFGLAIYLTLHQ